MICAIFSFLGFAYGLIDSGDVGQYQTRIVSITYGRFDVILGKSVLIANLLVGFTETLMIAL